MIPSWKRDWFVPSPIPAQPFCCVHCVLLRPFNFGFRVQKIRDLFPARQSDNWVLRANVRTKLMKNIVILILLVAAIALGTLFVSQQNKAKTQAAALAQTQALLAAAEAQSKEKSEAAEQAKFAETKAKILQDTLKETAANVVAQSNQVAELQAAATAAKTNAPANPFAAMFKDPKMKEMIKSQQKMVMGPMIEKNYAAAFKQMNLSPEQTASLKQLLQDKMLVGADMGMAMMDGSLDADKRAELGKQVKVDTDAYDAKIKELLGDDNNKAFQDYEKTVPERMAVSQFHDQLAGSANALNADQEQQLIQAMNQERTNFKWTTDYANKNPANGDFAGMFTEDKLNTYTEEQARLDGQVLARAKQILTAEQYAKYETYLEQQRAMQLAAMKMAGQMFGK